MRGFEFCQMSWPCIYQGITDSLIPKGGKLKGGKLNQRWIGSYLIEKAV